MTTLQRTTLGIAAALLIALALLLTWGAANAQDPPQTGTRLEPGLNLVGWVGETTPVSQLFNEIPQLESIWAWDAELDDWIVAGRGAPEWLGGLGRITAGMGLRMHLGGEEPFVWQRSTEPTRGLVKLRTGWNLVAWSGADQTPINNAVKGIGWSLRTVRRWDAGNQEWTAWTSPERTAQLIAAANADQEADDDSEMPAISRGEALWIEVARAVNWLQPTGILPRLVFPGGASTALQARVRQDLKATLAFYRTQYGIQADPDFTIYVPKDVDALIQAYRDDGQDVDEAYEASERALWNRASGWAGENIVIKQSSWPEDLSADEPSWARYTVSHEYFHILQGQLSSDGRANAWLVEGTASWADAQHAVFDGPRTWENFQEDNESSITATTPTLRSTESDNGLWHYLLGLIATDRLSADTDITAPVEFWRQLASTETGPHGRWASTLDWRSALRRVSGQTVSEFYADFDAWQREQAATNETSETSDEETNWIDEETNWIGGHVKDERGAPVAGLFVNAIRVEGETSVGWNQRAETGADGSFAVRAPEAGDYRLSVDINDDCTRYYSDGQLINDGDPWDDSEEAHPVKVSQSDVSGIDIRLPPNVCGEWQIRGRIVGPDVEPLVGIRVTACPTDGGGQCHSSASADDGSFAVTVDESGEYRISAHLGDGCSVYFGSDAPTTNLNSASPVTVADAHVSGILIQIPASACGYQIRGSIIQADGQPLADTYISACLEVDGDCATRLSGNTDDDGAFAITAPGDGAYFVRFEIDGCTIYFRSGGFTTTWSERGSVTIAGRSVQLNPRRIPGSMCTTTFQGVVLDSKGNPVRGAKVRAAGSVGRTGADGKFAFSLVEHGEHVITVSLAGQPGNAESCHVRIGDERIVWRQENAVPIDTADVRNNPIRIVIPESACERRIRGVLTDASGAALAGVWVFQRPSDGDFTYTRTAQDGSFSLYIPLPGDYRVEFTSGSCRAWARGTSTVSTMAAAGVIKVGSAHDPAPLAVRLTERSC